MNFQPIFPKLMRRFTNLEILSYLNSYYGNGEANACFNTRFPYLFFDYESIRENGCGWYNYDLLHKFIHELIHLLQFIFVCKMNVDLYKKYSVSFERFPSMIEAFLMVVVRPSLRKSFRSSILNWTNESIELQKDMVSASRKWRVEKE